MHEHLKHDDGKKNKSGQPVLCGLFLWQAHHAFCADLIALIYSNYILNMSQFLA